MSTNDALSRAEHEEAILEVLSAISPDVRSLMRNNIIDALADANEDLTSDHMSPEARDKLTKHTKHLACGFELLKRIEQEVKDLDKLAIPAST